jgi:hypothetical protein
MSNFSPNGVNIKFDMNGNALPFEGNTLIGYVDNSAFHESLHLLVTDVTSDETLKKKLVLLPESSYHITIFDCACLRRDSSWYWPTDIRNDVTIEMCTEILKERFADIALRGTPDINFTITGHKPYINTLGISFRPETETDAENLRNLRDKFSRLAGIRRDNHNEYEFHLTLGYFVEYPCFREVKILDKAVSYFLERLEDCNGRVCIKGIEFCFFKNMLDYTPVLTIK